MGGPSTRLRVRVIPGSTRPGIAGRHGEAWKLRVAAAPERGKANEAALELLAERLGVSSRDLRVVAGQTARDKTVEIAGLAPAEAERRLSA